MSVRHARPTPARRGIAAVAGVAALCVAVAGCSAAQERVSGQPEVDAGQVTSSASPTPEPTPEPAPEATVTSNIADGADSVAVDKVLRLRAHHGSLRSVTVAVGGGERLAGHLSADEQTWRSSEDLEPGTSYRVRAVAANEDGAVTKERTRFRTDDLTLDEQTYPSIAPLQGETVGVGMPVIVKFDVAVTDRAAIERHLSVETRPHQRGAWHWLNGHEVHWRPAHYWKPGTKVTVHADINSVHAGHGVYGQLSRTRSFRIGPAIISKINIDKHMMKVFRNGKLLRKIPVSAGKAGFTTRSGTKVIIAKYRHKTMDASTIGISKDSPEYYNIEDVEYAMRVTYSGEFLHAAPWSVGAQGSDNVSHGCVGMSTEDAAWLFNLSRRGDVVEVTGTDRPMEPGNGYTDWNQSFAQYKKGSALS